MTFKHLKVIKNAVEVRLIIRSNVNRNFLEVFQQNLTYYNATRYSKHRTSVTRTFFSPNICDLLFATYCSFLDSEQ